MNVLHIIVGLDVGGAELMLERLIASQSKLEGSVHRVVSLTTVGIVGQRLSAAGIPVCALGMHSFRSAPKALFGLYRLIKAERPAIVQTWMYHADLLGGIAARMAGQRNLIWGVRTTDVGAGNNRATVAIRWLCARLSGWVPKVIVCAAEASRKAHVTIGYAAPLMEVVPNGFDLARLASGAEARDGLRKAVGFADGTVVIGSVGRFNAAKDQHNFVRAAGLVAARHANVRFLLVGRELDQGNTELTTWIGETGHADRFVLLGERSDVPACLAAMDVFCLSSRNEGFPNVVGEAMAVGLPCVVTDVGDAALLVGDAGVVVPKEDAVALADGIERVLALPPVARAALGQRAKDRIGAEFTIDRARQRFEEIYQRVLNQK